MDKLNLQSLDIEMDNVRNLSKLFPEVVIDGKVDMKKLKGLFGEYEDESNERYSLNWPGKSKAMRIAQTQTTATLIPQKEKSKNWSKTNNIYIEGDNLEVLKILQKSYYEKISMIYIDPPYNTGSDFVYRDSFKDNVRNYLVMSGQINNDNLKSTTNTESSGRYHSNWLNMMYPRLKLARNLLKKDGVIFISIDDNEVENLKKICCEIFGEENFIGQWNWMKSSTPPNLSCKIKKNIEYILCFEKQKNNTKYRGIKKQSSSNNGLMNQTNKVDILTFPANIVKTTLKDGLISKGSYGTNNYKIDLLEDTMVKDGVFIRDIKLQGKFKWKQEKLLREIESGTQISIKGISLSPSYEKNEYDPEVPPNIIDKNVGVSTTESAGKALAELFDGMKVFDYPKPVDLIKYLYNFTGGSDDIILDFFSGSATTAQAIMELNSEDSGNRKFILVQIPEKIDDKSDAYNNGYKTISDIGRARIDISGNKIKEKLGKESSLDIGFKAFRLDSSNINIWDSSYEQNLEHNLLSSIENIKEGRSEEDILYEVLLKYGIDLNMPIEEHNISGKKVFDIGFGAIIACLDNNITLEVVEGIGKLKEQLNPDVCRVIFMDNGFSTDSVKTNAVQVLKRYNIEDIKSI